MGRDTYVFDCFECAIHALAPTCARCGCKIVGHGVASRDDVFCCAHCVRLTKADEREIDEEETFEWDDEADVDDREDIGDESARRAPRR